MNRRKGFLLSLALALICSVLGAIGGTTVYWIREQPQLDIEPSAMVRFKGGVENYIPTPALQDLPGPLYVRSIIQSENKKYKLVSPELLIDDVKDMAYEVTVPGDLEDGLYTVSLIVQYKLNPIRYTEQSFTIALLYIDGGHNAVFDNNDTTSTASPESGSGASSGPESSSSPN